MNFDTKILQLVRTCTCMCNIISFYYFDEFVDRDQGLQPQAVSPALQDHA